MPPIGRGFVACLAAVAGCGTKGASEMHDATVVDVAPPVDPLCASAEDAGATTSPPFAFVQAIFDRSCVSCHSAGADLVLTDGVAWSNLVSRPAPPLESCGGTLVVPGQPDASYLYQKLSNDHPCAGARMPRGEFGSEPLADCVTALVRAWIAEGAPGPGVDAAAD